MARPLKPLVKSGGYYPSKRWTPLVYPGGYTTANGGGQPEPEAVLKTVTGAQDAYAKGDKVWFPDVNTTVYESIIDSNVWSPTDYPQGWKAVD
jgi:hypothetical protein